MSIKFCVVLIALLCALPLHQAQPMELNRQGVTVAGALRVQKQVDGPLGTSRLYNPYALCGDYKASDPENNEILISDNKAFRLLNRSDNYLETWFNNEQSMNTNTDGLVGAAGTMIGATSCQKYSAANTVGIFFAARDPNSIRYIINDYLRTYNYTGSGMGGGIKAVSISTQLYALSRSGDVLRCSVSLVTPENAISNCQLLPLSQAPAMNNDYIAILATNNYLFIASGQALYLYTIGGTFIASQSGPFVDVRRDESGNLYAATSSALYRVTATSTSLTATLWAGTENPSCDVVYGNTDGLNPTFCGICRIFPFSENEIYMTMPTANIVRALQLPPVHVTIFFGRTPFPFGMVGADTEIIPGLEDYISQYIRANVNADDAALQAAYPPSLNRSASMLDPDTWNTYFTVDVPQQAYDNTTTDPEIWGANFWPTLTALEAYYNLTDEVVYGDRNVMPTCNRTKMDLVERDVATRAREVLGYPLVYTNRTTNTTAQNVSGIKLLLPSSFNNETTSEIIANTNFTEVYLQSVAAHYPADRHLTLNFTSEHYHFDRLNEAQQQQVRFLIQQKLKNALATCGADPAYNNSAGNGSTMAAEVGVPKGDITTNGIGGGNGAELICVPTVGITNQSRVRVPGSQYDDFDYSVYVPEGYGFTGDQLHTCFNDIDWSDIADYVDGQMTKKKKKCDTGCIVGIAVAAAVVACILIVILVVLTSKRRRLAAVVAPPAEKDPGQPGFSSTVDLDEAENPLRS